MNVELGADALEYGRQARRALESGDIAALDGLGAWDLDPRRDADELEAAAALCRAAGYRAVPYPVAERLSGSLDPEVDALAVVLPCWTLLGMLDRAVDLTREHVLVREQFGQQIARFQGAQFQLTDAEVERSGAEVLATYALWSIQTGQKEALADALTLRLAVIEAADVVFRVAHQLHGAIGFCDETPLSWLSRRSLPLRREPFGRSATLQELTRLGVPELSDEGTP